MNQAPHARAEEPATCAIRRPLARSASAPGRDSRDSHSSSSSSGAPRTRNALQPSPNRAGNAIGGLLAVYDTNGTTTGQNPAEDDKTYIYLYDANGNVGQLVAWVDGYEDATGSQWHADRMVATYEYTPYGTLRASAGDYADENPFRFSTKQWDDETGLGYWGYRYYSPTLGRWISRDPIGERGGMNLMVYVTNAPPFLVDALGMKATRNDIEEDDLEYSCNCGWIDWDHAHPNIALPLWTAISGECGQRSTDQKGVLVTYRQFMEKWGVRVEFSRQYYVSVGLTLSQQESIALGIFKEVAEGFEHQQGRLPLRWFCGSGFSREDLPSDLIAFYRAVRGYTKTQVQDWCGAVGKENSLKLWDCYVKGVLPQNLWAEPGGTSSAVSPGPLPWAFFPSR